MKAIVFDQPGDADVLRYGEVPDAAGRRRRVAACACAPRR